jgi:hypothetical protein
MGMPGANDNEGSATPAAPARRQYQPASKTKTKTKKQPFGCRFTESSAAGAFKFGCCCFISGQFPLVCLYQYVTTYGERWIKHPTS